MTYERGACIMPHIVNFKEKRELLKKKHERHNVADRYYSLSTEQIKAINEQRKIPLNLAVINTTGEYNISSMIRTASIFGFRKAYVFGRRRFDRRGLVGANHYIEIERINSLDKDGNFLVQKVINKIVHDKLAPIVFEIDGQNILEINWKEYMNNVFEKNYRPAIFVGNEWEGFDPELIKYIKTMDCSLYVRIPQNGVLRSLNVSNAMSIAAWEIVRSMGWIFD